MMIVSWIWNRWLLCFRVSLIRIRRIGWMFGRSGVDFGLLLRGFVDW